MGYFFQNIGQMAGFFLNETVVDKPQKGNKEHSGGLPFDSMLQALNGGNNVSSPGLDIDNKPVSVELAENKETEIELIEKTDISSDIIRLLVSKDDNAITLEIPSDEISQLRDGLAVSQVNRKAGWSFNGNLAEIKQGLFQFPENSRSISKISFRPADLLIAGTTADNRSVPVSITDSISANAPHRVDISRLIQLVSEYPEPIRLEVEIAPQTDDLLPGLNSNSRIESSFRFDLRDMFEKGKVKDSGSIEGVRSITGRNNSNIQSVNENHAGLKSMQLSKFGNRGLNTDNNQSKAGYPGQISLDNIGSLLSKLDFNAAFQMNGRRASSFLNNKNVNPKKNNMKRNDHDDISARIDGEKLRAGAGESKTDAKDNSSALSKISAGSEPVSENISTDKEGVKLSNGLSTSNQNNILSTESKTLDTAFAMQNSIENIEEIKSNILRASRLGQSTIKMKLHAENLGNLRIKLVWDAGKLLVDFNVETKKAGEVVSSLLPELKASLEDGNMKIANINLVVDQSKNQLAFGQDPQFQSGPQGSANDRQFKSSERKIPHDDANPSDDNLELIENNGRRSVHNGLVDLKA